MSDERFRDVLSSLSRRDATRVDCAGAGISDDQLDLLVTAMEHTPATIKVIDLSENSITPVGVPFLMRYLNAYPVEEVYLQHNQITESAALHFFSLFEGASSLKLFDLHHNPCTHTTITRLFHLGKRARYPECIQNALLLGNISDCTFTGLEYANLDRELLHYLLLEATGLRRVDFTGVYISAAAMSTIGGMLKDSHLSSLCLHDCSLTNDAVMKLVATADLPNNQYLQSLDLSANMNITNDLVRKLIPELFDKNSTITTCNLTATSVSALYKNHVQHDCDLSREHPAIKVAVVNLRNNASDAVDINLQWSGPLPTCMAYLAGPLAQSSVIQRLNISNSRINDAAVEQLAFALQKNSSLKKLELANCEVTAAGIQALFVPLSKARCNIEEVNIANNNLGEDSVGFILAALQVNPKLTVVNVDANPGISANSARAISGLTLVNRVPSEIRSLLPLLERSSRSLTALDFSASTVAVHDDTVWILMQALRSNTSVHTLNFSHNSIGDRAATYLARFLRRNKTVHTLNLSSNSLGNRGARDLCEALTENTGVVSLDLSDNMIDGDGVRELPGALRKNNTLLELKLHRTRVPEETAAQLQVACSVNHQSAAVKAAYYALLHDDSSQIKVQLTRTADEPVIDDHSVTLICSVLAGRYFVQEINLHGNYVTAVGCSSLVVFLADELCGVTALNLSGNPIDDQGAAVLASSFSSNKSLVTLDLRETRVTDNGADLLAQGLESNSTIAHIFLPDGVQGEGATKLRRNAALGNASPAMKAVILSVESGVTITSLDLSHQTDSPIDDVLCQILCRALVNNLSLQSLDISHNVITSTSIPYIREVVESCNALTHLDLSSNAIEDDGAAELIECLKRVTHLQTLILEGNQMSVPTLQRVTRLLSMNRRSVKLKEVILAHERGVALPSSIYLNGNSVRPALTDEDVIVLATVLETHLDVETLDLANNAFSDPGCIALAHVLRGNHSLVSLNLSGNLIGADGGEALFHALKVNPQLQELGVAGTAIPRAILDDISSLLHVNQTKVPIGGRNRIAAAAAESNSSSPFLNSIEDPSENQTATLD